MRSGALDESGGMHGAGGASQFSDSLHPDDIRRNGFLRKACGCEYDSAAELLEYDYNYDDSSRPQQRLPRIRERGEFYVDSYNTEPWNCSFGTAEEVSRVRSSPSV
jgi:hypothetical protein